MAATPLSADTRARILDAAWQRVRDRGTRAVSVKDIAAAAGVSRQLVYFHYGNRAGLLVAMARYYDERSGFRRRVAATRELPPRAALEALLREWCAYIPELLPVARALEAALITGEDGASAWRDRFEDLWQALQIAVERVAASGALRAGWTVETATDWAWAHIQPATYSHLVEERGWSAEQFTDHTVSTLTGELVT